MLHFLFVETFGRPFFRAEEGRFLLPTNYHGCPFLNPPYMPLSLVVSIPPPKKPIAPFLLYWTERRVDCFFWVPQPLLCILFLIPCFFLPDSPPRFFVKKPYGLFFSVLSFDPAWRFFLWKIPFFHTSPSNPDKWHVSFSNHWIMFSGNNIFVLIPFLCLGSCLHLFSPIFFFFQCSDEGPTLFMVRFSFLPLKSIYDALFSLFFLFFPPNPPPFPSLASPGSDAPFNLSILPLLFPLHGLFFLTGHL